MNAALAQRWAPDARAQLDVSLVAPGLYQGSEPPPGRALHDAGFDLVVFCAKEIQPDHGWYPGVDVVYCPLGDSREPMTDPEWELAVRCGQFVADWIETGGCADVTCAHGRNRSGIVTVLTLYLLEDNAFSGPELIHLVRAARGMPLGRPTLSNPSFVERLSRLS